MTASIRIMVYHRIMSNFEGKRIRDPVHGLILFEPNNERDELAWKLLNTSEMQRLRRIRQLGVSEFVYPGATHSRFSHSIGVYHTAKILMSIIKREMKKDGREFDEKKADDAVLAALLHDIGHGPFSHAFEAVQKARVEASEATQEARGKRKRNRHEDWTADIIRNPKGEIIEILGEERANEIASRFISEDPSDIYHAVFSSSFDADRLDYIRRDRMMTGTHAGHIDFEWLMDNIRVAKVSLDPDDEESEKVDTFCFAPKAIPAAEQFLLARYTLHEQVYFHKTTRAMEAVIKQLFTHLGKLLLEGKLGETGLPKQHPLVLFFQEGGDSISHYLALDDMVVWASLDMMIEATDSKLKELALRLKQRRPFKPLCLLSEVGSDQGRQNAGIRRIEREYKDKIEKGYVIKDDVRLQIYSTIGGDEEKAFKRLHVIDGSRAKEISDEQISRMIWSMAGKPKRLVRFYFAKGEDRDRAREIAKGGR